MSAASKLEEVTQKIIDILQADSELTSLNYYFGPPFTRKTPFVYVKWIGGPIKQESLQSKLWSHRWKVVVVDSAKEDDVAEKSVMDKIERIYEVLKANPTLGGVVRDSQPVEMLGETITIGTSWNRVEWILVAAQLVLEVDVEWSS